MGSTGDGPYDWTCRSIRLLFSLDTRHNSKFHDGRHYYVVICVDFGGVKRVLRRGNV